jgi:hypothetical protein
MFAPAMVGIWYAPSSVGKLKLARRIYTFGGNEAADLCKKAFDRGARVDCGIVAALITLMVFFGRPVVKILIGRVGDTDFLGSCFSRWKLLGLP